MSQISASGGCYSIKRKVDIVACLRRFYNRCSAYPATSIFILPLPLRFPAYHTRFFYTSCLPSVLLFPLLSSIILELPIMYYQDQLIQIISFHLRFYLSRHQLPPLLKRLQPLYQIIPFLPMIHIPPLTHSPKLLDPRRWNRNFQPLPPPTLTQLLPRRNPHPLSLVKPLNPRSRRTRYPRY